MNEKKCMNKKIIIGFPYCHPSAAPLPVKHPTNPGIKYKERQTNRAKTQTREQ